MDDDQRTSLSHALDDLRASINQAIVEDELGSGQVSADTMDMIMGLIEGELIQALSDRAGE
jgi:hypothetical protein